MHLDGASVLAGGLSIESLPVTRRSLLAAHCSSLGAWSFRASRWQHDRSASWSVTEDESERLELCREALDSADTDVLKSHSAEADGVENVFGVHDQRPAEEGFDLAEIEGAKFRPARANDQRFSSLGRGVR